ncbi:MAG: hypothetical protein ACOCX3_00090 [Chloroflexota bacterium]
MLCGITLVLVSGACSTDRQPPNLTGRLQINAPHSANAGEVIEVSVGPVVASHGLPVGLVAVGTKGPQVYTTAFDSAGMAYFTIPSDDTRQPGYLALIAAADDARGEASILLTSARESIVGRADAPGIAIGLTQEAPVTPQPTIVPLGAFAR